MLASEENYGTFKIDTDCLFNLLLNLLQNPAFGAMQVRALTEIFIEKSIQVTH